MGEYHERFIRKHFQSEQDYQDYKNRKLHVSWKETALTTFGGVRALENLIDEKATISVQDKNDILDFFTAYAEERAEEIGAAEKESANIANIKKETVKMKRQRDLALILCVIFFAIAMLFAFRPVAAGKDAAPVETRAEAVVSFAEWTRRQKAEYIASSESDKYHRRSCEYVENILDENRVYYDTAADAERDSKTACSLCRPHGITLTQESTGKAWTSVG